jgi:hypothetical protein
VVLVFTHLETRMFVRYSVLERFCLDLVVFSLYLPVGCFGFANSVPQEIRLLVMRRA